MRAAVRPYVSVHAEEGLRDVAPDGAEARAVRPDKILAKIVKEGRTEPLGAAAAQEADDLRLSAQGERAGDVRAEEARRAGEEHRAGPSDGGGTRGDVPRKGVFAARRGRLGFPRGLRTSRCVAL